MPLIDFDPIPPRGHPLPVPWLRDHLDPRLFPPGFDDDAMYRFALRVYTLRTAREFRRRARELRLPWRTRFRIAVHRFRLAWQAVNNELPDEVWEPRRDELQRVRNGRNDERQED